MGFKKRMKKIGRYTWELVKMAFPSLFMYFALSIIVIMLTMGKTLTFSAGKVTWWAVCLVGVLVYNGLMSYVQGTMGFEMLVSGNMKRVSCKSWKADTKCLRIKKQKNIVLGKALWWVVFWLFFR